MGPSTKRPFEVPRDVFTYTSLPYGCDSILAAGFDLFEKTHPNEKPKEFRHNYSVERANVVTDVQNAWRIVKSMAVSMILSVDEATTDTAIASFSKQLLDGYDLFMVQAMTAAGVSQVLTDDGDFCSVPGIQVFTANRSVVDAARAQGKLLTRPNPVP